MIALGWCGVVFTVLGAMCLGGTATTAAVEMRKASARATSKREAIESRRLERENAYGVLERLAMRLEARFSVERMFPESLGHRPPEDAWGNPLRYERKHSRLAELRSAGVDGVFETPDDLVRTLGSD